MDVSEQNDRQLLNFIAATVETMRDEMGVMREQMATKDDLAKLDFKVENLRDDMNTMRGQMATKDDLAELRREMATKEELGALDSKVGSMREQMVTKDDLARLETKVNGEFEQVHLRFDNLERVVSTRFGLVETEVSRLRSAVYVLAKDKPDVMRFLGQPFTHEDRPWLCAIIHRCAASSATR